MSSWKQTVKMCFVAPHTRAHSPPYETPTVLLSLPWNSSRFDLHCNCNYVPALWLCCMSLSGQILSPAPLCIPLPAQTTSHQPRVETSLKTHQGRCCLLLIPTPCSPPGHTASPRSVPAFAVFLPVLQHNQHWFSFSPTVLPQVLSLVTGKETEPINYTYKILPSIKWII